MRRDIIASPHRGAAVALAMAVVVASGPVARAADTDEDGSEQ